MTGGRLAGDMRSVLLASSANATRSLSFCVIGGCGFLYGGPGAVAEAKTPKIGNKKKRIKIGMQFLFKFLLAVYIDLMPDSHF